MPKLDAPPLEVKDALAGIQLPAGVHIRAWLKADFPTIQRLSAAED